jgi:hypothetical protein
MTFPAESQKAIDGYLAALRRELRELMDDDVTDIAEEIHVHILDKTSVDASAETVAATLVALGSPAELASRYRADELMRWAQASRSPVTRMQMLFRWATWSVVGVVVFAVSVLGYSLGGGLVIAAVAKLMNPHYIGLWKTHQSGGTWGWGFGSLPSDGHDLLGWWAVPIGLGLGALLVVLTFWFGSWSLRRFRRPRVWRRVGHAL